MSKVAPIDTSDILYGVFTPEGRNQEHQVREQHARDVKSYKRRLRRAEAIREQRSQGLNGETFLAIYSDPKRKLARDYGLTARLVDRWRQQSWFWEQEAPLPMRSEFFAYKLCLEYLYPIGSEVIFSTNSYRFSNETARLEGYNINPGQYHQINMLLKFDHGQTRFDVPVDENYLIFAPEREMYPLPDPPVGLPDDR